MRFYGDSDGSFSGRGVLTPYSSAVSSGDFRYMPAQWRIPERSLQAYMARMSTGSESPVNRSGGGVQ